MGFSCLVRDQEVDGSNPFAPTNFPCGITTLRRKFCFSCKFFCVPGARFLKSLRRDKPFSFKFIVLRCEIQFHCESLFGEIRYRIALLGEKPNPETNFSP